MWINRWAKSNHFFVVLIYKILQKMKYKNKNYRASMCSLHPRNKCWVIPHSKVDSISTSSAITVHLKLKSCPQLWFRGDSSIHFYLQNDVFLAEVAFTVFLYLQNMTPFRCYKRLGSSVCLTHSFSAITMNTSLSDHARLSFLAGGLITAFSVSAKRYPITISLLCRARMSTS